MKTLFRTCSSTATRDTPVTSRGLLSGATTMKTKLRLLAVLLAFSTNAFSQDPNFYIYLCFGQSNMESGGKMDEMDRNVDKRFQVLADFDSTNRGWKKGQWYEAVPPLAAKGRGICLVDYFGRTMVAGLPENIRVGVVKVAVPGCKIELFEKLTYTNYAATVLPWMKNLIKSYDGNPYQFLVDQAKVAQKDGVIKGILLHQGESNPNDKEWPAKVKGIYANLIKDLNLKAGEVPLLAGETVHADQARHLCGIQQDHGRTSTNASQFPCHFLGWMYEQRPPAFQLGGIKRVRKALRRENAFLAGSSSCQTQMILSALLTSS